MAEATLENNEIKQRAVRRLIVAVALVLVAVVILTYLSYYKPSKVITKPIPESLPPPPPPIVTGPEPEQILPAQPGQSLPDVAPLPELVPTPPPTSPPPPSVVNKPLPPPGPGPRKAPSVVEQKHLVPAQTPSVSVAAKPAEVSPAPLVTAKPSAAPSSGYVVQFGVFSNPQNALQLAEKLKQAGIDAQVEARVQLPAFKSKAEAEAALTKMREKGITATIVAR